MYIHLSLYPVSNPQWNPFFSGNHGKPGNTWQEALDVLLDVKFQLSSNAKPLEPSGAESAALHRPLRTVEEANEAGEDT